MRGWRGGCWLLVLLCCAAFCGCVQRRLTVRSNPPGALVYIDNYQIGQTPCSVDYTYYATRNITLVRDGYETLKVKQEFPVPWYQIPPIDFVSENLIPWEIRDERSLTFDLTPQVVVPTNQLLSRADSLRRGAVLPPGSPAPDPLGGQQYPGGPETLPPGGRVIPEEVPPGAAVPAPGATVPAPLPPPPLTPATGAPAEATPAPRIGPVIPLR